MMTREEAIKILVSTPIDLSNYSIKKAERIEEAMDMALAALRPVSREQVEKVWRGEWEFPIFTDAEDGLDPRVKCSVCGNIEAAFARWKFCPNCGATITDEAVQMVMERMEALYEKAD